MSPRFNFAPVSSAPSTLLRIASGWFLFNGVFYGLLVAGAILGSLLGKEGFSPTILFVLSILVGVTTARGACLDRVVTRARQPPWWLPGARFCSLANRVRATRTPANARDRYRLWRHRRDCVVAHLARVAMMVARRWASEVQRYRCELMVWGGNVLRKRTATSVIRLHRSCNPMPGSVEYWQLTSRR